MRPTFLAVITARGGSKGVHRKNIRDLAGRPLIAWTIEEAKKSKYITKLILSSEDAEIIEVARNYGCEVPFVRPKDLAADDTPGVDPILHAIEQCPGYDYVILLQPTSPLRTAEDIDGCIESMLEREADFGVSVTESEKSPCWMYTIESGKINPLIKQNNIITRRQDLSKVYTLNGAVYVAKTMAFKKEKSFLSEKTVAYIMPAERSFDVDTELDLKLCEYIIGR